MIQKVFYGLRTMAIIQCLFDDFFGGFDLIEIGLTLIMIRFLLTNLVPE